MEIARAVDLLLRHELANLLLPGGGASPARDAFERLAEAQGGPPVAAEAAARLSPPLDERDLEPPLAAVQALIDELTAQMPPPFAAPLIDMDVGDGAPLDKAEPAPGTAPPPAEVVLTRHYLRLRVSRIQAIHVTEPRTEPDEFLLTGGYVYNNSGMGSLGQVRRAFTDGEEYTVPGEPFTLASVVVVDGVSHFDATIVVFEEDLVAPRLASALGLVIQIVLTLGVDAAVRYIGAAGLPSELSDNARKLLADHGITTVRSWFEDLIGPEMFEIVTLRTSLDWPPGKPVTWRSWIAEAPGTRPTMPPSSVGPGVHAGAPLRFREARHVDGANGPAIELVADGGLYEIDFDFALDGR